MIIRTTSDKLHVAGQPVGDIQRCTRCHTKLHDRSGSPTSGFWRVGGVVLAGRRGQRIIENMADVAGIRECGRLPGLNCPWCKHHVATKGMTVVSHLIDGKPGYGNFAEGGCQGSGKNILDVGRMNRQQSI